MSHDRLLAVLPWHCPGETMENPEEDPMLPCARRKCLVLVTKPTQLGSYSLSICFVNSLCLEVIGVVEKNIFA